ncbi:DUF1214 domain-containing protein [Nocardia cyriacigeorgica]|uniref:DUF1214 domain-containing protein n=1 Tax=Nocardia cyriacigeorgica TaxID=135487 RepID=UPI0018961E61|nr:DUF1214 domain-containing protein [Nocardia cyriacigeorgica]MBF6323208.1 DUF1214 domain-containing protein [Nocardia cyriacigeorgica]
MRAGRDPRGRRSPGVEAGRRGVGKFGADEGDGTRYLILPPGFDGTVPDGYLVLPSDTDRTYALLRSVLVNLRDRRGEILRSDRTYRMRVPAEVPVSQYWSVTMYDGEDHTLIRGNTTYSVSSQKPALRVNDDGSVDVYFGPKAIPGLEANFIGTGDSETFELMFRFYGVGHGVMNKQWQLEDPEAVDVTELTATR